MKTLLQVAAVLLALSALTLNAQIICPDGYCPVPDYQIIEYPPIVESPVEIPVETLSDAEAPSGRAAVRVRTGGGCGSGSVCGRYKTGSLILTNAHVAGTRVGREVDIDAVVNGQKKSLKSRVIMAAYSDRTLTDWAILYVPDWKEIKPVSLSKNKPSGSHYTKGSPRCVWPLVTTTITTADIADNSPLWRWRPNSIGGQSGSGVWSRRDHRQYGLLTWSWGGLGAGQQTSEIYRQAKEKSTSGGERPPGLQAVPADGVVVEVGFFQQADIDELPIWGDEETDPTDPVEPPNDGQLSPEDYALFARLKAEAETGGASHTEVIEAVIDLLEAAK